VSEKLIVRLYRIQARTFGRPLILFADYEETDTTYRRIKGRPGDEAMRADIPKLAFKSELSPYATTMEGALTAFIREQAVHRDHAQKQVDKAWVLIRWAEEQL